MATTNNIDLDHLHKLLLVLRASGVTRAKFGTTELDIALPDNTGPVTFEDIDKANESARPRTRTFHDVTFPGGK